MFSIAGKMMRMRSSLSKSFLFFIAVSFTYPPLSFSNPWGKDADMAIPCSVPLYRPSSLPSPSTPLVAFGEVCIKFHQNVISPADGPRSNFIPSSSQYTLDGIRKYGFFYGCLLGFDRLMRENDDPWMYRKTLGPHGLIKYDPVR